LAPASTSRPVAMGLRLGGAIAVVVVLKK
jgi:hypothetical protein